MAKRGSSQGDKPPSPSTVFESPVSATQADDLGVDVSRQPPEDGPAEEPVENDMLIDSPVATGLPDSIPSPEKLSLRRVTYPINITREIRTFGEYALSTKYHSAFLNHLGGDDALDDQGNRPASSRAVSTISVAFSPDGETMASTHGDHTVKISCCTTGRLLQSLDGHPRTPWTVKYHPKDPRIIASGCLGHQVRIWNWVERKCLNMIRLEFAIISLSFHPTGTVLAVANGTRLHFWGVDDVPQSANKKATNTQPMGSAGPRALLASLGRGGSRSSRLTEMDQRHMLRCVHFPPDGKTIIIGGVNPTTEDPRRRRSGIGGAGMSFYLRLWDFDIEKALEGPLDSPIGLATARRSISNVSYDLL
jgi:activator-of-BECN1-regulated-autophagy protein 1